MKNTFLIALLILATQFSFADTIREENIRKDMVERVSLMMEKLTEVRKELKEKKVVEACLLIDDVFDLYPAHVKDVGSRMDLSKKRVNQTKNAALSQLIQIHRYSNICRKGAGSEYVDPKQMRKEISKIVKSLKRQRYIIEANRVDLENYFSYEYEF
jgi:hypothetical protein